MKAIDRVKAHYERNKMAVIDVPEWGAEGAPFKLFYNPMTPFERKAVYGENGGFFDAECAVDVVILKALDEHGNRLFAEGDRHELLTACDGAITGRIAMAIALPADKKAIEKN